MLGALLFKLPHKLKSISYSVPSTSPTAEGVSLIYLSIIQNKFALKYLISLSNMQ